MAEPNNEKVSASSHRHLLSREKRPSPVGTTIYVGLRAADAVLQYYFFRQGWGMRTLSTLGGSTFPFATPRDPALAILGLPSYPALIAGMALGSSVKDIIWALGIKEQEMQPHIALIIAGFATVHNTANTLLSCWALTSLAAPLDTQSSSLLNVITRSPLLSLGLGLYCIGTTTEIVAEFQRKFFKDKPENQGKPYGGGLWSLATNINYGGFTIWRTGFALSAGGPVWAGIVAAFFVYDFTTRAIPSMHEYCIDKYGDEYEEIRKKTPYKLIPFIY